MRLAVGLAAVCCIALSADNASATATTRRFALAVGANHGGPDRPGLSYATSDAESFARVLQTLGGVRAEDLVLLDQPSPTELSDALETLRRQLVAARASSNEAPRRTEVMVYFSGHADEAGLLLGAETFPYARLRSWMDAAQADLRVAVVDACASGALTRLKGSRRRKPFLVDASSRMRGHVFLTSSSADEAAQESDRIGGSFFTHYLVSGLRGAADVSGEGEVTINEAYQFAFHETLGRTAMTRAGAQHPSYDINLSGSGEVVMTDVRQNSAVLVLSEPLSGRLFIRNQQERLEVELFKPQGRRVELGLEPGRYSVRNEADSGSAVAAVELQEDGRLVLDPSHFAAAPPEPAVVRGGAPARSAIPGGRWRLGARLGTWKSDGLGSSDSEFEFNAYDTSGAALVSHRLGETWSIDLTAWTTMSLVQSERWTPDDAYVASVLIGARRYLPSLGGSAGATRPFLTAAAGPYFRHARSRGGEEISSVAAGGRLGGGIDVRLARWCLLESRLDYNFTADFTTDLSGTFGVRTHYAGFELALGLSVVFGK